MFNLKRVFEEDVCVERQSPRRVVELLARRRRNADGLAVPGLRQVAVDHSLEM